MPSILPFIETFIGLSMEVFGSPASSSGVEAAKDELTTSGFGNSFETAAEMQKDVEPSILGSKARLVSVCAAGTIGSSGESKKMNLY